MTLLEEAVAPHISNSVPSLRNDALIGNDIVDIRELPAAQHRRTLDATCTKSEREGILGSSDAALSLAERWSVKEAAYKALRRRSWRQSFDPRSLDTDHLGAERVSAQTRSHYRCAGLFVECIRTPDYIHSVAASDQAALTAATVAIRRGRDWRLQSREVRGLLSDLLLARGFDSIELAEDGQYAPLIFANDRAFRCSVSMSHDGVWRAVAIA